jgi:hypothetical protein
MGLEPGHPAAVAAGRRCLEEGLGDDGGINFWRPRRRIGETCVTGMILGQLCHFRVDDDRIDRLLDYLLREQMPDGGWNCRRPDGARHSSFHTTISVLEGLRAHAARGGGRARAAGEAAARGREFLLAHRLFRSHRTGRTVATEMTRFHFPPHWRYDVLRALDHLCSVGARATPACATPSSWSRRAGAPTGDGRWRAATRARSTSPWRRPGLRADGTRCAPCASWPGGRGSRPGARRRDGPPRAEPRAAAYPSRSTARATAADTSATGPSPESTSTRCPRRRSLPMERR